jgi:glyoxylase-like metal-dependent hydrolase (beta-lactamase superfamily II)
MAPAIHHLNCGTMCPFGERLLTGAGSPVGTARLVCHVLLIEGPDGLVLVDTGLGTGDVDRPRQLGRAFTTAVRPKLERSETALAQVEALGFTAADVRHLVMTHLDLDHAGGLPDFPDATVHVFAAEHAALLHPGLKEKPRYIPAHTAHGPKWAVHDVAGGDRWNGFESVQVLPGDSEVVMVPLPGHTRGHTGVAVRDAEGWLLHCGDAYFHHGEMASPPHCPPGLRAFQELTNVDGKRRRANQDRLRELVRMHGDEVRTVCAHDAAELDRELRAAPIP